MRVVDPGHEYVLDSLDGEFEQRLVFVKREGPKYPGNIGSHPGTTTQEVLRALIDRLIYVNEQWPCEETAKAAVLLIDAIVALEHRAARIHNRSKPLPGDVVSGRWKCKFCGHCGCNLDCKARKEDSCQ